MGVTVVCDTLFATCAEYEDVADENVPKSTRLSVRPLSVASVEGGSALVTVTVYVCVVLPSSAVTSTVMTFLPTPRGITPSESVTPPSLIT